MFEATFQPENDTQKVLKKQIFLPPFKSKI